MSLRRYGLDQILLMLHRADVKLDKGKRVPKVCKRLGITQQAYNRWLQQNGGMAPDVAKALNVRQKENWLVIIGRQVTSTRFVAKNSANSSQTAELTHVTGCSTIAITRPIERLEFMSDP